ncbi:hypothetical protein HMPREF9713_03437 [Myroides odoratimimus CCUG 12700]|uniref:hypothetical protein n=1 Tax=Myroides odoratimimus TaxID=76832 RepID=UPI0003530E44|nr:hypothetical protein [Myroides odoratimimus]EPH06889.1 hypothetical protein HMPREF9713_03437 [Myroides odoratimimus CCUG 12700]
MNQKEQKTRKKWGHLMYYGLLFIIMSFVQTSIAMYRFKDQPSGDITFNFFQDIFLSALFVSLFYILLLVFIIKIPRFSIQIIIHSMLLVGLWFLQDLSIFIDREASWSTYSFTESISYTWMYSRVSLLCALVIYIFLSFRLYRHYTK